MPRPGGGAMTPRALAWAAFGAVAVLARWRFWPWPAPGEAPALDLVAVYDPALYWAFWLWGWAWPAAGVGVAGSFALSAWDVWGPRGSPAAVRGTLPKWPLNGREAEPAIVIGEQHHPVDPVEVERPTWLTVPAAGLFTGTAIFGATGSGKTAACMRPFVAQLFSWQWNPLDAPEVDSYSLAYQLSSLLNQLFGKGKEPFWQQASTNLLRNLIELYRIHSSRWVTLRDLYRCAIDSGLLSSRLVQACADVRDEPVMRVTVRAEDFAPRVAALQRFGPWAREGDRLSAPMTRDLLDTLEEAGIEAKRERPSSPPVAADAEGRLAAFELWLEKDWRNLDGKLRTSVVEGISSFLGIFDQPEVARVFCPGPPAGGEVPEEGATFSGVVPALLQPLPRLRELIENGTVLCLNMPAGTSPALARAVGVMLKAALRRPADMAARPDRYWRPAVFVCDEYQSSATVGEDEPQGDEKAFPLTRQSRVVPIVATQSISSLKSATRGDAWKTLLQSFRTRVFLTSADPDTSKAASEMCGTVERLKASYNFSENTSQAGVSLLSGKAGGARASMGAGRSY